MEQVNRLLALLNQHFPGEDGRDIFSSSGGRVAAMVDGVCLQSSFQALVSSVDGRVIGHEACLRLSGPTGRELPSELFFQRFSTGDALARMDRICRSLHLANHLLTGASGYLFLGLHPRHLPSVAGAYGQIFAAIVHTAGFPPEKIVLQILADGAQDEEQLARAVGQFKAHGFLIALDDFGRDHGRHTVDRLFRLKPHVVMFSRVLLQRGYGDALSRLVRVARELGALSGMKGIAGEAEVVRASQLGLHIQGEGRSSLAR